MTILRDDEGTIVKVALYNLLNPQVPQHLKHEYADELLPIGSRVAIIEPFYKLYADGK